MPYLPIDLDGRRNCYKAANVLGLHAGIVSWGLQELWEHAWREHFAGREDADVLSEVVLAGCLGPVAANPKATEALEAFGFLERVETGWRVRGAKAWLFALEGKKRGGLAAKKNLIPGGQKKKSTSSPAEALPSPPEVAAGQNPRQTLGSAETLPTGRTSALSPSTQHLTPKRKEEAEEVAAAEERAGQVRDNAQRPKQASAVSAELEKPRTASPDSPGIKFFCWFQNGREQAGYVREVFSKSLSPSKVDAFYSEALMELNGDEEALKEAAYCFGEDGYWLKEGCPFNGFISQWRKYAPTRIPN